MNGICSDLSIYQKVGPDNQIRLHLGEITTVILTLALWPTWPTLKCVHFVVRASNRTYTLSLAALTGLVI